MSAAEMRGGAVAAAIRAHRLVVVLRRVQPAEALLTLVSDLADAGARIFEITMDAPSAADDLRAVRERVADRGLLVGAGTVTRAEQLDAARAAAADFAVSPVLDRDLLRAAVEAGMPFIPGAFTPTEIAAAWAEGATFVKLFPASAAGPSFVRELHGPMPDVEIVATGGVDGASAAVFLAAGAAAVGIGGWIVRADAAARRALVAAVAGATDG